MNQQVNNLLKTLSIGLVLSILLFNSMLFFSLCSNIETDSGELSSHIKLGWPFTFYEQFSIGDTPFLNHGWNVNYLLLDCILFFIFVFGLYFFWKVIRR